MRLHLGCGERYLTGYTNIDFPPSAHTVQTHRVADEERDLLTLRYARESVDEIRLHHVFEHFSRARACALLAGWHSWLRIGGTLRLEVPDFARSARPLVGLLSGFSRRRHVALRHIFGSQEATWAVHQNGYSKTILSEMLRCFGFTPTRGSRNHWKGTHNIDVLATKESATAERAHLDAAADRYLRLHLVDESPSETRLLAVWMDEFRGQLDRSLAV